MIAIGFALAAVAFTIIAAIALLACEARKQIMTAIIYLIVIALLIAVTAAYPELIGYGVLLLILAGIAKSMENAGKKVKAWFRK